MHVNFSFYVSVVIGFQVLPLTILLGSNVYSSGFMLSCLGINSVESFSNSSDAKQGIPQLKCWLDCIPFYLTVSAPISSLFYLVKHSAKRWQPVFFSWDLPSSWASSFSGYIDFYWSCHSWAGRAGVFHSRSQFWSEGTVSQQRTGENSSCFWTEKEGACDA